MVMGLLTFYLVIGAMAFVGQAIVYMEDHYFDEWLHRSLGRAVFWPVYLVWGFFLFIKNVLQEHRQSLEVGCI